MKKLKRFETYNIDRENVRKTPQGFLEVMAYTARTGVQRYMQKDGSILREYRPEKEVFSPENIDALRTSPVTNGHPPEMVTPENSEKYMVGFPTREIEKVDDPVFGEKYLKTWLTITKQDAINAINSGKAQISNGYNVNLVFSPGLHKGEKYDAIQTNLKNNHIAIVWNARGGPNVKIHLDEEDAEFLESCNNGDMDEVFDTAEMDKISLTRGALGALGALGIIGYGEHKISKKHKELKRQRNIMRILGARGIPSERSAKPREDFAITAAGVGAAAFLGSLGLQYAEYKKKTKELARIQSSLRKIERITRRNRR